MPQQSVLIADQNNVLVSCELTYNDRPPYTIRLDHELVRGHVFGGDDVFECLIGLRRRLEKTGARILCNGARIDTFPSAMSRSMGGAFKLHVTEIGKPASEVVEIFDQADLEKIGSVEQQRAFHQTWFDSLETTL